MVTAAEGSAGAGAGAGALATANVVLLGATKGMGRAVARRFAERGARIVILGRDEADLARSAADLVARGASYAGYDRCDLEDPATFVPALEGALRLLG